MKWYKNLKISLKLILGFLVVAIIAAVVGIVGLKSIYEINEGSNILFSENTLGIAYAGEASSNFQRLRYNALKLSAVETEAEKEQSIATVEELSATIDDILTKYESTIVTETDRNQFDEMMREWNIFKAYMQEASRYSRSGLDEEVERIILNDCDESGRNLRKIFDTILESNVVAAESRMNTNEATTQKTVVIMIIVMVIGVIISVALGIFISRLISKPIGRVVMAADALALGDVNIDIQADSKDEIGVLATSFRKMIDNIRNQALAAEKIAAGDLTVEVPINEVFSSCPMVLTD